MLTIDLKKPCMECTKADLDLTGSKIYAENMVYEAFYTLSCRKADVCKQIDGAAPVETAELLGKQK